MFEEFFNFFSTIRKSPRPLSAFYGSEDYLIEKYAKEIKESWLKENSGGEVTTVDLQDLSFETFYSLWQSRDLFAPSSLLVIRRCQKISTFADWLKKAPTIPDNRSILLLFNKDNLADGIKIALNSHHIKAIFLPTLTLSDMKYFLQSLTLEHDFTLTEAAQRCLIERVGLNAYFIENEIKKIKQAVCSKDIDVQIIESLVPGLNEEIHFRLTDYILAGDVSQAIEFLQALIRRGESPLSLLGILARHCRTAIAIASKGTPVGNLPGSVIAKYKRYLAHRPIGLFSDTLESIQTLDIKLKSSNCCPENALTSILFTL